LEDDKVGEGAADVNADKDRVRGHKNLISPHAQMLTYGKHCCFACGYVLCYNGFVGAANCGGELL
jgi:hypothetical protein